MDTRFKSEGRYSRRRVMRGAMLGGVGLAGAALIGCGDDEEAAPAAGSGSGSAASPTTAAGSASTATPAAEGPKQGGELAYASVGEIGVTNMFATASGTGFYYVGQAYSTWLTRSYDADYNMTLQPDVVKEWEITDDGLTYVLHLQEGVKFHDRAPTNGRELTADDIAHNIERETTGDSRPRRGQLGSIEQVETPDDLTVRLTLKSPVADFLFWLADPYRTIVPREMSDDDLLGDAVGTGPFIVESLREGVGADLVANPNYYRGRPYLDSMKVTLIPDQDAALASFRAGDLHISPASSQGYLRPRHIAPLLQSIPDANIHKVPNLNVGHIRYNLEREPFGDVRVRKAIGLTINDADWLEALAEGEGSRTPPVPNGLGNWALAVSDLPARGGEAQIAEAVKLLDAAGYNASNPLSLVDHGLGAPPSVAASTASALFADAMSKINVQVETRNNDYASWIAGLIDKNFDINLIAGVLGFTEAGTYVETYFWDEGGRGYTKHGDTTLNDMIARQRTMVDQEERRSLVHDIQRHVIDNEYYTMLQSDFIQIASQPFVQGYELDLLHGGNMRDAWKWSLTNV